jgi:Mrp family chromosome partitioning ATPase
MKFLPIQSLDKFNPDCASQLDMTEEMIVLYQSIDCLLPDAAKITIQFSSSRTGEGTTLITREFANVARNVFGKSVLIIDANIRNLDQCRFFGYSPSVTLLDVLSDTKLPVCNAIYNVNKPDISICALAQLGTTFYGIFTTKIMMNLLDRLKKKFDLIIIDSAPAPTLSLADSVGISSSVDGVVLIIQAETTRWPLVEATKNRILRNGGNILGVVLNKRKYYIPELLYRYF